VIGDALASIAVIAGAVVIIFTGQTIVDPLLGILIGAMLLYGAFALVLGSVRILLEFAPRHVDADTLTKVLMEIEGVKGIHDIHIWSICSHIHAMSAHVLVDRIHVQQTEILISIISKTVKDKFQILHTTLQFECAQCLLNDTGHEGYH
jgi:cobalt-zinc-cadmium efflux system protein